MRSVVMLTLCSALALTVGCGSSHHDATTGAARAPSTEAGKTESVVVRPVTQSGEPAAGYTVIEDNSGSLDCGTSPEMSPVATSNDILYCSPSAESAVACWKGTVASHAICYRNPWSTDLVRIPTSSGFPTATASVKPQPLGLLLNDGDHCLIRDGGAWSSLSEHPTWLGYYSCTKDGAVWGPAEGTDGAGIDRSFSAWTVQVGPTSGTVPVTSRRVVKAYFVGTTST